MLPVAVRKSTDPVGTRPPGSVTVATRAKSSPGPRGPIGAIVTTGVALTAVSVTRFDVPDKKLPSPGYSAVIGTPVAPTT